MRRKTKNCFYKHVFSNNIFNVYNVSIAKFVRWGRETQVSVGWFNHLCEFVLRLDNLPRSSLEENVRNANSFHHGVRTGPFRGEPPAANRNFKNLETWEGGARVHEFKVSSVVKFLSQQLHVAVTGRIFEFELHNFGTIERAANFMTFSRVQHFRINFTRSSK